MIARSTIQFDASPDLKRDLEAEAHRLHLTLAAYVRYLHERHRSNDPARLDRVVEQVFGTHGEAMRKLAE
ncbi:MAG: hypothetical protein KF684_00185 [Phycisphaeraceae bacterium]|nr:hypothetical protein [Phycisphaeraceae bacterium]